MSTQLQLVTRLSAVQGNGKQCPRPYFLHGKDSGAAMPQGQLNNLWLSYSTGGYDG